MLPYVDKDVHDEALSVTVHTAHWVTHFLRQCMYKSGLSIAIMHNLYSPDMLRTFYSKACRIWSLSHGYMQIFCISLHRVLLNGNLNTFWRSLCFWTWMVQSQCNSFVLDSPSLTLVLWFWHAELTQYKVQCWARQVISKVLRRLIQFLLFSRFSVLVSGHRFNQFSSQSVKPCSTMLSTTLESALARCPSSCSTWSGFISSTCSWLLSCILSLVHLIRVTFPSYLHMRSGQRKVTQFSRNGFCATIIQWTWESAIRSLSIQSMFKLFRNI